MTYPLLTGHQIFVFKTCPIIISSCSLGRRIGKKLASALAQSNPYSERSRPAGLHFPTREDRHTAGTLGARRRLGTLDLLRLRDILHIRDDEGLLRALLAEAESQGDLDVVLEGAEELPEDLAPLAVELVELLSRGEARR